MSTLNADLSTEDGVGAVEAALTEQSGDGPSTITCFECVEHLASFVPLVSALVRLAERNGFTVLLSVPNDAFWSIVDTLSAFYTLDPTVSPFRPDFTSVLRAELEAHA